jgi:hypothetical protein
MNSRFSNTITEPAIFRASSTMAFVTVLQMVGPAVVASLGLYLICVFYGVTGGAIVGAVPGVAATGF